MTIFSRGIIMKLNKIIIIGILVTFFISCSRYYVKTDYDRNIDFYDYQTFKWIQSKKVKIEQNVFTNSLNQKRFATAIETELSKKGYNKIEEGKPDFKIIYHIRLDNKIDFSSFGYNYWMGSGRVAGFSQNTTYEEGTFIIDIIDRPKKKINLAWYC